MRIGTFIRKLLIQTICVILLSIIKHELGILPAQIAQVTNCFILTFKVFNVNNFILNDLCIIHFQLLYYMLLKLTV